MSYQIYYKLDGTVQFCKDGAILLRSLSKTEIESARKNYNPAIVKEKPKLSPYRGAH